MRPVIIDEFGRVQIYECRCLSAAASLIMREMMTNERYGFGIPEAELPDVVKFWPDHCPVHGVPAI